MEICACIAPYTSEAPIGSIRSSVLLVRVQGPGLVPGPGRARRSGLRPPGSPRAGGGGPGRRGRRRCALPRPRPPRRSSSRPERSARSTSSASCRSRRAGSRGRWPSPSSTLSSPASTASRLGPDDATWAARYQASTSSGRRAVARSAAREVPLVGCPLQAPVRRDRGHARPRPARPPAPRPRTRPARPAARSARGGGPAATTTAPASSQAAGSTSADREAHDLLGRPGHDARAPCPPPAGRGGRRAVRTHRRRPRPARADVQQPPRGCPGRGGDVQRPAVGPVDHLVPPVRRGHSPRRRGRAPRCGTPRARPRVSGSSAITVDGERPTRRAAPARRPRPDRARPPPGRRSARPRPARPAPRPRRPRPTARPATSAAAAATRPAAAATRPNHAPRVSDARPPRRTRPRRPARPICPPARARVADRRHARPRPARAAPPRPRGTPAAPATRRPAPGERAPAGSHPARSASVATPVTSPASAPAQPTTRRSPLLGESGARGEGQERHRPTDESQVAAGVAERREQGVEGDGRRHREERQQDEPRHRTRHGMRHATPAAATAAATPTTAQRRVVNGRRPAGVDSTPSPASARPRQRRDQVTPCTRPVPRPFPTCPFLAGVREGHARPPLGMAQSCIDLTSRNSSKPCGPYSRP